MTQNLEQISLAARNAAQARDWARVSNLAKKLLEGDENNAEGHFLVGLVEKASNRPARAVEAFSNAISRDGRRYDAAIELAGQLLPLHQYAKAVALLRKFESYLGNSPRYLDMAGTIYTNVGLPERGLALYKKANELQPGVDSLQAKIAACSVFVGEIDEAKAIYRRLLQKYPNHQRNHYELSRLERARDSTHIEQMENVLRKSKMPPERNIYLYYAIGKELEDLEKWDEAFEYYGMAGNAAAKVANYDVGSDLRLIDKVISVCNASWMEVGKDKVAADASEKTPIFIVGLPRTGTTLTERILSSHSLVESIGETYFMQIVLKRESGIVSSENMNASVIEAAAKKEISRIADAYIRAVSFKFGGKPMFIEKFPENIWYLGFIAKAYPHARIIHQTRNPMDSCFAMYKQSYFRYAYTLEDLGRYYVAYSRLVDHWRRTLKDRLIEVEYESLVADQQGQTRELLDRLGLDFEEGCLNFHQNVTASNTASTVQIREKIHARSVNRWTRFEKHLRPLKDYLEAAGITVT